MSTDARYLKRDENTKLVGKLIDQQFCRTCRSLGLNPDEAIADPLAAIVTTRIDRGRP